MVSGWYCDELCDMYKCGSSNLQYNDRRGVDMQCGVSIKRHGRCVGNHMCGMRSGDVFARRYGSELYDMLRLQRMDGGV